MSKKYELTKEVKIIENCNGTGTILYRIRALKNFGFVMKGDIGGWVESEENLSQRGTAWIGGDAIVCGNARVYGSALVLGLSSISNDARIYGQAYVASSMVYDHAKVHGKASVYGGSHIHGNANIYGKALLYRDSHIFGNAKICGHAVIEIGAHVQDSVKISGRTVIQEDADFRGSVHIKRTDDYIVVGPIGPQNSYITFCKIGKDIHYFYRGVSGLISNLPPLIENLYAGCGNLQKCSIQFQDAMDFAKAFLYGGTR